MLAPTIANSPVGILEAIRQAPIRKVTEQDACKRPLLCAAALALAEILYYGRGRRLFRGVIFRGCRMLERSSSHVKDWPERAGCAGPGKGLEIRTSVRTTAES